MKDFDFKLGAFDDNDQVQLLNKGNYPESNMIRVMLVLSLSFVFVKITFLVG
jgi:hypothetical protein